MHEQENSNVVRLFRALRKHQPERQLVYYQPGVGTYNDCKFITTTVSNLASALDKGIAMHLGDHVKEGYQFIMRNYQRGNKICLFGFSRGGRISEPLIVSLSYRCRNIAHTAQVLAGMLYKVGLLPPDNDQQVDFAFSVYQTTGPHGIELSKEFKRTFAIPVVVEFLGVWDTVASVGIIPQSHPYTSVNYSVKTVRHALALDERRARFRPQTCPNTLVCPYGAVKTVRAPRKSKAHQNAKWTRLRRSGWLCCGKEFIEVGVGTRGAGGFMDDAGLSLDREQDLDVDDPNSIINRRGDVPRDDWVYVPPERTLADVKEVWFAGAHADVGGGSHHNAEENSLSFIPLRWMIKESLISKTDILFDPDALLSFGFDFHALRDGLSGYGPTLQQFGFSNGLGDMDVGPTTPDRPLNSPSVLNLPSDNFSSPPLSLPLSHSLELPLQSLTRVLVSKFGHNETFNFAIKHAKDATDGCAEVWDQLELAQFWWILEAIPTLITFQRANGDWVRIRRRNFGLGRFIPFSGNKILVHKSVEDSINDTIDTGEKYKPAAVNWDIVKTSGMLVYVS
ncbi:hypothetical protein GALMADRAFT_160118 [Galerina marginata CBS 339.88]|uniref:T6SS Phospholipase effector Tle1-like catalytic domain-containing protein n=1 Tax=Galerina marginata (strain CBS 339.88) TaxID=685588 RepID=A0A067SQL5_GALM3|nr:hypothetical protein GALMADRAFT_160118 [Galerina marginata CBS 339.88]